MFAVSYKYHIGGHTSPSFQTFDTEEERNEFLRVAANLSEIEEVRIWDEVK